MELSARLSIVVLTLATVAASGCAPAFEATKNETNLVKDVQNNLGCGDARSKVFDAYYREGASTLSTLSLSDKAFGESVGALTKSKIQSVHRIMAQAANASATDENRDSVLKLARLEMRSEVDAELGALNKELDQVLAESSVTEACVPTESVPAPTPEATKDVRMPAAITAAHLTMATAYQSCSSVTLPALNASTEMLQGVAKDKMIDSVGWGRKYTDLSLLKKTDPYLHGVTYPKGCMNQDAKPLVYDYGGVPVVKSATQISLFENSGGGPALGIDCSAFISSATGVAGFRYKEGTANKPVYTRFVSRDFIDPKKSGWNCFDAISMKSATDLMPGDIAAVVGHIVMVDSVGEDPFGLAKVKSASACATLDYRNFDFAIIQSAATKNSVGINRFVARDYMAEASKIREVFVAYGKAACMAKFDGKGHTAGTSTYGLIRHRNTAACMAPSLELVGQSCVESCVK